MKATDIIFAIGQIAGIVSNFTPGIGGVVLGLVSKYGATGAVKLIEGLKKEDITEDDIKKLHELVKSPDTYFK